MKQKKLGDFAQAVLNYLEKDPAFVVQALEWLGNHYQVVNAITESDALDLSPEEYLEELRWAKLTEDYAYFGLLCLQKLRRAKEKEETEEPHGACDPGTDLPRR